MKASVITLHSVFNYGTQLQALATQEKLKQYFDVVEFSGFRREDTHGIKLMKTFTKGNILKVPVILPTLINWHFKLNKFQKKYLNVSKNIVCDSDVYFTGSDQVWNTGWNKGIIKPFYLGNIENKPKYAFSSSFGMNKLDEKYIDEVKTYLKDFNKISVREESGLDILNQLGLDGIRILDPTLSMPASFWRNIAPKNKIKGDYILIYNLNRNKKLDEYAKELSKKTGYKVYRFCTRYDQIFRYGKSLLIPDILEFITLIDNAKIVLTDSFHATAFSINMNTEVICIYPENYSNRISEFLKLVDLEDRHINSYNDFSILDRHIDFNKTNKILDNERIKVDEYLSSIKESLNE